MKRYDIPILSALMDKYENSVASKQGSIRNTKITIKSSDKLLKDYWSDDAYQNRDIIDAQIDEISQRQFVFVIYNHHKELDEIHLNIDMANEIYRYLGRKNPKDEEARIVEYLSGYTQAQEPLSTFAAFIIDSVARFKSIRTYIDSMDELKACVRAISEMVELNEDLLVRNFSTRIFNDSKKFEDIENRVCRIFRDFGGYQESSNDEILKDYHLVRNPTYAYIKGDIRFKVNRQIIDLSKYEHEIALSSEAIKDLEIIDIGSKKVLTIENLTTFTAFENPTFTCIYLGGFHNSVKRELLRKIYTRDPRVDFFHFGDIDVGGFLIFKDLVEKSGIPFRPFQMDLETLVNNKKNWISLSQNDNKRLKTIDAPQFDSVVKFMLENNCKLEQEAITILS
jgi:hypothetical protein